MANLYLEKSSAIKLLERRYCEEAEAAVVETYDLMVFRLRLRSYICENDRFHDISSVTSYLNYLFTTKFHLSAKKLTFVQGFTLG